ncbi:sensor histidine kinase [Clavibacter michiganensis]|uniref:histidine kinase n=1 Tax=Clavibacter michiganensis subsp. insidiosus TaxID=33014 RepID=A0A0D5CIZ0_9MICO|nr:HAMP domain-containing sensor histidine kinase [Clavibacter michiganensis]AJW79244.1 histidine kinase [Clavibacter michiganensis subsp. insidiosus]AWF98033.1 two-component sensor histidine kinase [Clavibacter michiganensis subsp. insidiosus]
MREPGRRRRSLRVRATTAVALIALVLGALGAVAFAVVLRASLEDGVREAAGRTLETVADAVAAGGPQAVTGLGDDDLVQVLDGDGRVIAHGDDADGPPLYVDDRADDVVVDGERRLVVAGEVEDAGGVTVVVAASLEEADEAVAAVVRLLLVAVPVVVALVALLAWIVVGRALRPVERIRRDAQAIGSAAGDARIDEPGTGDEVDRLARTLNGMLAHLEAARTAQRRFVSDASHELRSPLATVRQPAELARIHPDRTSLAELADVVLAEGGRQQDLVDALLVLSRLDHGAALDRRPVDLDDVALEEVARLRGRADVRVDGSGITACRVSGDARLLALAVRDLVENAARHAATTVTVSTTAGSDGVVLTVDDDGRGIPAAERERVLDRFVRLDEGRDRDSGGSGLGLAIVREVAEAHGGSATVDAAPGGGARVALRLPAEQPAE